LISQMLHRIKRLLSVLLAFALISAYAPVVSKAASSDIVYHETFEEGRSVAVQSGDASLTYVTGKHFDGNEDGYALYVSNRSNNWDAADFHFSDLNLKDGKTYTITVRGYVDEDVDVPEGAQAWLQTVDSYGWLAGADFVAGSAFTLTCRLTVDTGNDRALRIQSNEQGATVPFYIGDILITAGPETSDEEILYHETFEAGTSIVRQSGDASLIYVDNISFDGNEDGCALYVTDRKNNWDGADLYFEDLKEYGVKNGETYSLTVKGYVEADVTTGAAIWIQLVEADYQLVGNTSITPGEAFSITMEFTADTDKYKAIRIKTNDENPDIPFYIGEIIITRKAESGGTPSRPPAEKFVPIDFEGGTQNGFTGRAGTEILTVTDEENHTEGGKYSLKVEGREQSWHGPQVHVENNIDLGSEYLITVWVRLYEPETAEITLSTQIGQGQSASYPNLLKKTIRTSDGWVKFEAAYRYNSVGNEFVTIYVESSNPTASFYIDDISFEPTGSGPIDIERDLTPIKDAYSNYFLIGSTISADTLEGLKWELLNLHYNVVTAENAMKPEELQKVKENFTFEAADKLVNTALASGFKVHGHVLVWHQQSPDWMNMTTDENGNTVYLSREEALENMRTHIRAVMEHFGDSVISWDVVNEAMNDNPSNPEDWRASLRQSPWYHSIGPDYVEQAFREARAVLDEHGWDIKLYYNDYNLDNQNKALAVYNMVKELNEKYMAETGRLLIDGIGMQGHYSVSTNPANVELSLQRFISLGVEVSISELDIRAGSNGNLPENLAVAQGQLYAQLFNIFKKYHEHIARVTFWGLDDGSSWRASENPLLFDRNFKAKPAYYAVIDPDKFLEENPQPALPNAKQSSAYYASKAPVIDGTVDEIWNTTPRISVNQYLMAWQGATGTVRALWDEKNLYILFEVQDTELDKSSANPWEQDSVEIFIDENNNKTSFYQDDDGQYRVNFDNETSFNPEGIAEGFESATSVSSTGYTVEMKIPFKAITPSNGTRIGFDAQVNDGENGARQSIATWNDSTGNAYQDTSVFGILTLTKPSSSGGSSGSSSSPKTPQIAQDTDGAARIVTGTYINPATGEAVLSISKGTLEDALKLAKPDSDGIKTIRIAAGEISGAKQYKLSLPAEYLTDQAARHRVVFDTPFGSIIIPGRMLTPGDAAAGQVISIVIGRAETSALSDDIKAIIGERPVIELRAQVDGRNMFWNNPDAPVIVSIDYTPADDERDYPENITVWYIDNDGNMVPVPNARYNAENGAVTFKTDHFSKYAVAFVRKTFSDSGLYPWAQRSIEILASKEILSGVTETNFSPAENITRGEFISALVKALGLFASFDDNFDDVRPGHAYYNEIGIAKKLGITNGTGNNMFGADQYLTREDMMVLACRALEAAGKSVGKGNVTDLSTFSDADKISAYATESIAWLVNEGLIVGCDGILAPDGYATRASAAVLLYKIYSR